MADGVKKIHEEGYIVFNTPIGEVTVALPDDDTDCGFSMTTDSEDDICSKIIFDFTEPIESL